MTLRTFTHDQLILSPLNVRTNQEDANATEALEASIEAGGLLYPLIVHPVRDDALKQQGNSAQIYGVCAGGRRWRAIGNLIKAGRLRADWPIDCVVRDVDQAQITEISLAENLIRRELRPYEIHAAIAKAHDEGASAEDIASRCGQRVVWVRQQLRLGKLVQLPRLLTDRTRSDLPRGDERTCGRVMLPLLEKRAIGIGEPRQ